jgi:endonuclease G, mitochondrial
MKQFLFILVVLFFVVFFAVVMVECSTQKDVVPSSNTPQQVITTEDATIDQPKYLPKINKSEEVVYHTGFTLSYNEEHEQANWVAYELTTIKLAVAKNAPTNF